MSLRFAAPNDFLSEVLAPVPQFEQELPHGAAEWGERVLHGDRHAVENSSGNDPIVLQYLEFLR